MKVLCLLLLAGVVLAKPKINPLLSDETIAEINSRATTWKAGRNFDATTPLATIKKLVGAIPTKPKKVFTQLVHDCNNGIPETWDAREAWPECDSIKTIRDQSSCSTSWAFGAVEAMSDRICILSNQTKQTLVSAQHVITCCWDCSDGCQGGTNEAAWIYWYEHGIVSGGLYNTSDGCQAYSMPPCDHDDVSSCGSYVPTPVCKNTCDNGVDLKYQDELTKGQWPYYVTGIENIQKELMKSGPLEVLFIVYSDFLNYKGGVYQLTEGAFKVGEMSVKLLGWGVEDNVPYWLLANSWNSDWGEKGFFKVMRGCAECNIEDSAIGAIPIL